MTDEQRKGILILGLGYALFWLLKFRKAKKQVVKPAELNFTTEEKEPKERKKMKKPTIDEKEINDDGLTKNAFGALNAYVMAYNNDEPQEVLDELNREFAKEFKVRVYRRKSDDKIVVCDLEGNEILVNN